MFNTHETHRINLWPPNTNLKKKKLFEETKQKDNTFKDGFRINNTAASQLYLAMHLRYKDCKLTIFYTFKFVLKALTRLLQKAPSIICEKKPKRSMFVPEIKF